MSAGHQSRASLERRVAGGLLGLAVGDALGATVEFMAAEQICDSFGRHTEICGGGAFGWRAGQGTDDTDLTYLVARAYAQGYSLRGVADDFLGWYDSRPRDVGGTAAAALAAYREDRDPHRSGLAVLSPMSAGNCSLMRCLATGMVRPDARHRRAEAVAISAVTHADARCVEACSAYCDLVHHLLEGAAPDEALDAVLEDDELGDELRGAITAAGWLEASELSPSSYVVTTLQVGIWALLQPRPLEDVLIDVVNLGGDADTTGAVAGGLLGVRSSVEAIPHRWLDRLEYRDALTALVPRLVALRRCGRPPRRTDDQE